MHMYLSVMCIVTDPCSLQFFLNCVLYNATDLWWNDATFEQNNFEATLD